MPTDTSQFYGGYNASNNTINNNSSAPQLPANLNMTNSANEQTGAQQGGTQSSPGPISVDNLGKSTVTPPTLPSSPTDTNSYPSIIAGTLPPPAPEPTDTTTPYTNTSTGLLGSISKLMGLDTNKAADTQTQNDLAGVTKLTARQNEITGQLTALNNQANAIPLQNENNAQGVTGMVGVNAANTRDLRDNAIKALSLKSEFDVNQGNLANAKDTAQRAIDLTYQPIEQQIDYQTKLLQLYTPFMNAEQKTKADALTLANTQKATALADQKKQQQDVVNAAQTNGDATSASAALKLDPNSSTFTQDLAKIQSGIKLKDSYQVENSTDAFGNPVSKIFDSTTGKFVSGGNGGAITDSTVSNGTPIVGSGGTGTGSNKLSFDQYGLLANTDFNPTNMVDALSQKYLDQYIKNGTVPTASTLGRSMKPEAMAQVDSRARDLYFKATGTALPSPQIIKGYQDIITKNNQLANNLQIQEQTVKNNVDLSLANIKKNNLNSIGFKPLDNFINSVNDMLNDPATGQLIAQNSTIQNELGSLLAVKNASGTTVYDKLTSAGIITSADNEAQIKSKVGALLGEASNFADSLKNANASLYKQVDPFLQDPNNPARAQMKVESALNKIGANYNDVISKTPQGKIPVLENSSGQVGYITPEEYNVSYYTKL